MEHSTSAVLTGDFIDSRAAGALLDDSIARLRDGLTLFETAYDCDLKFTRFRGDGWQILINDPRLALHGALYVRAVLAGAKNTLNTRIAIGLGHVDHIGTATLSDAKGQAFVASGQALDALSPKRTMAINGAGVDPWMHAVVGLCEHIADGWTTTQSQAVAQALLATERPHKDIATALGITRQAVQSRLSGAGFNAIASALYAFGSLD